MRIVGELTKTCTVACGDAKSSWQKLSDTVQFNFKQKTMTASDRIIVGQKKGMVANIEQAEHEFAKVVLELPGVFSLLTKSAIDKCSERLHSAKSFFQTFTGMVRFDIFSCFDTICNDLVGLGKKFTGFIRDDEVNSTEEVIECETGNPKAEEEILGETVMYIEVLKVRAAIDLILQMLLDQGNLNHQRSHKLVWGSQAKLESNMRVLKKIGNDAELTSIISNILIVCQLVLNESKSINQSEETYTQVISILTEVQQSLHTMVKTLKDKLGAQTALKITEYDTSKEKKDKDYPVLEQIMQRRCAKSKELHTLWKRYDQHAENSASPFQIQKEIAKLLSGLTAELNALSKTLDLISKASTDLTNVSVSHQGIPKLIWTFYSRIDIDSLSLGKSQYQYIYLLM